MLGSFGIAGHGFTTGRDQLQQKLTFDRALQGTKTFSEKYVERGPYEFFPEQEVVGLVQQGLAENQVNHGYRYCP